MTSAQLPERQRRDPWVMIGLTVATISAAVSSFDGLRSLALATGWSEWQAPLLPLTIDSLAASSIRVWLLRSTTSSHARRLARLAAIGAVAASLGGNSFWHLHAAGLVPTHWAAVLTVGTVPPVVLAAIVHLTAVRSHGEPDVLEDVPGTGAVSGDGPRYGSEDELLVAAQAADSAYRARHGRQITRDALRRELRIGGQRATEVLRRLRAEQRAEGAK